MGNIYEVTYEDLLKMRKKLNRTVKEIRRFRDMGLLNENGLQVVPIYESMLELYDWFLEWKKP